MHRMTGEATTIRPADLSKDALAIFDGAKDFISRMDYRDFLPETDEELMLAVGRVLNTPGVETLLAERGGRVVGGLGLIVSPHLWNPEILAMEELFFWTAPTAPKSAALRLLRAALSLAAERGVSVISFKALTTSPKGVGRAYERLGLRPVETSYMGLPQ